MFGNIIEKQEALKGMPQQQLAAMVISPSEPLDATLALGELQRRKDQAIKNQARQATPGQTVAQQTVMEAMTPSRPAPALPMPQGQPGPGQPQQAGPPPTGMSNGGDVSRAMAIWNQFYNPEAIEDDPLRTEELESLTGATAAAEGLYPDESGGLRDLIRDYRGGSNARSRDRVTELLASIGANIMGGNSPNYLSNLGGGLQRSMPALTAYHRGGREEQRQNIEDESALARLANERRGNIARAGTQLFGTGRAGLAAAVENNRADAGAMADLYTGEQNRETQLSVANSYASRASGNRGDPTQMTLSQLNSAINSSRTAATSMDRLANDPMTPLEERTQYRVLAAQARVEYEELLRVRAARMSGRGSKSSIVGEGGEPQITAATPRATAPGQPAPTPRTSTTPAPRSRPSPTGSSGAVQIDPGSLGRLQQRHSAPSSQINGEQVIPLNPR